MAITLVQCAVLLGAAVLAVSIFRLLKLSSILGYVAAGMVIGPWGFRLVSDVPSVMSFAEFGIVLLLFIIPACRIGHIEIHGDLFDGAATAHDERLATPRPNDVP